MTIACKRLAPAHPLKLIAGACSVRRTFVRRPAACGDRAIFGHQTAQAVNSGSVRNFTSCWRKSRCSASGNACSFFALDRDRLDAWRAENAVQIARASCASFLLPLTKGRTVFAGVAAGPRGRAPGSDAPSADVPPHASIATRQVRAVGEVHSRNSGGQVSGFKSTISRHQAFPYRSNAVGTPAAAVSTPTTVPLVFISDPPVCL